MFTRNSIQLSAALHELSSSQRYKIKTRPKTTLSSLPRTVINRPRNNDIKTVLAQSFFLLQSEVGRSVGGFHAINNVLRQTHSNQGYSDKKKTSDVGAVL